MIKTHLIALLGTALLIAPALAQAENSVPPGSIRPAHKVAKVDRPGLAKIDFKAALDAALAKVPGAVVNAELEVEDGTLLYSFEIVGQDHKITEVEVDAGNGNILDVDQDEDHD